MRRSQNVQLMHPALLAPFVSQLDLRDLDTNGLLADIGLTRRAVRENTGMLTARQVHTFIGAASEASRDDFFCWTTGLNTNPRKYLMFSHLITLDGTLGEALTRLSMSSSGLSTASQFGLFVDGDLARFSGQRLYRSEPVPQTDVFVIGTLVSLISYYQGRNLTPFHLSISAYNPALIPTEFGCQLTTTGDASDTVTLKFPAGWLLSRPGQNRTDVPTNISRSAEEDLIEFLASALEPHLSDSGLTAVKAAGICGSKLREINDFLAPQGVTLAELISDWRAEKACALLRTSDERIADIGTAVGYPDATSFSRTFRQWTGMSPRQYRLSHV